MNKAAKRYTKALFDFSIEQNKLDVIRSDLTELKCLLGEADEFAAFVADPLISPEQRRSVLEKLLGGRADPRTLNFLYFLDEKGRLDLLDEICSIFDHFYLDHQGILKVEMITASALNSEQISQIKLRLQARFGKEIEAEVELDPNLLGGFKVRVGDTIYDYSIATQLDVLRQQLINA